jgi:hypothetical protein
MTAKFKFEPGQAFLELNTPPSADWNRICEIDLWAMEETDFARLRGKHFEPVYYIRCRDLQSTAAAELTKSLTTDSVNARIFRTDLKVREDDVIFPTLKLKEIYQSALLLPDQKFSYRFMLTGLREENSQ